MELSNGKEVISVEELKSIPIFFIVGRPRSGTTLLKTLFDAHPEVKVPPECQFIILLEFRYARIKYWTKSKILSFYSDVVDTIGFNWWKIDPAILLNNLLKMEGKNTYGDICKVVYFTYNSDFKIGKLKAMGDKNPGYAIYTDRLIRIFPEAKFIQIIRDPRDNYISLRKMKEELPMISYTVSKWAFFIKKFETESNSFPNTHLLIKYEDLVQEKENCWKKLTDFIGVNYDSDVFNYYLKKDKIKQHFPEEAKNQSSLMKEINSEGIEVWKQNLSLNSVLMANYCAGKYGFKYGYMEDETYSSSIKIRSFPGKLAAQMIYILTFFVMSLPFLIPKLMLINGPRVIGKWFSK